MLMQLKRDSDALILRVRTPALFYRSVWVLQQLHNVSDVPAPSIALGVGAAAADIRQQHSVAAGSVQQQELYAHAAAAAALHAVANALHRFIGRPSLALCTDGSRAAWAACAALPRAIVQHHK